MKQDDVAGKIVVELMKLNIVDADDEESEMIVYTYLQQAYAVGWDIGYKQGKYLRGKHKPVMQKDQNGKLIAIHASIKEASLKTGLNVANIGRALRGPLKGGSRTSGGCIWEYVNKTTSLKETSELTIEQSRQKSTPPKLKTHVSKTGLAFQIPDMEL